MKILETKNAKLIILIANILSAGFFIGQGSLLFIINVIGIIPLLILLFSEK